MTEREAFEAYYLSQWYDREDGIQALRSDTEGFVERDWRVWQAAISYATTDVDAAYAIRSLSSPVPGGQLGLIETHPNYVAGFKDGHAAGKRRATGCSVCEVSSRICERGTKSCTVEHPTGGKE